jgi:hypothetical protein
MPSLFKQSLIDAGAKKLGEVFVVWVREASESGMCGPSAYVYPAF